MSSSNPAKSIPVLLLKTKSSPTDAYEDYFNAQAAGEYDPTFIPVLEHKFKQDSLRYVRQLIDSGAFRVPREPNAEAPEERYGGIIFTSQRAVEAFTQVVQEVRAEGKGKVEELLPAEMPLYVVGPATARGLKALELGSEIVGEETGNGDALAAFILENHGKNWEKVGYAEQRKLPLLFLVGEKRRDVIPKTLQSEDLPQDQRIGVREVEVYETGEMASFKKDFTEVLNKNIERGVSKQWVVVFSPQGCKAMLESLGYIDKDIGKAISLELRSAEQKKRTFIATIGPTTRDYLRREFSIDPDVCAEQPTPEGVGAAIHAFMLRL